MMKAMICLDGRSRFAHSAPARMVSATTFRTWLVSIGAEGASRLPCLEHRGHAGVSAHAQPGVEIERNQIHSYFLLLMSSWTRQRLSFPCCALIWLTAAGINDLLVLHSGRLYPRPDGCSTNGQHCSALWLCALQPTTNSHGPVTQCRPRTISMPEDVATKPNWQ